MVGGASALARKYKVSNLVIGLTIVAFGTSAPELVVNAVASFQGSSDMVLGNEIESNVFNILLIIPVSAMVHPIAFRSKFNVDIGVLIAGTLVLLLAVFIGKKRKHDRWEAAILFLFYLIYTVYLISEGCIYSKE